jgi:N-acyl-D-aspartate/D-glutamate deacylase
MTLMQALRLERSVPAMARKGRIQRGADADIVVFDPATVIDRATFAEPNQRSVGMLYVLVAGRLVVSNGELQEDVRAGRPIRR